MPKLVVSLAGQVVGEYPVNKDRLEVYEDRGVIKRKMGIKVLLQSLKGDLLEGIKGDKHIPSQ